MYITTEGVKSEQAVVRRVARVLDDVRCPDVLESSVAQREDSSKITIQATGATSWRKADVKYRKNEAFVDVIETVNLIMSTKGATRTTQK